MLMKNVNIYDDYLQPKEYYVKMNTSFYAKETLLNYGNNIVTTNTYMIINLIKME